MFRDEFWQQAYLKTLRGLSSRESTAFKELSDHSEVAADKALEAYDKRFMKGRFKDEGSQNASR